MLIDLCLEIVRFSEQLLPPQVAEDLPGGEWRRIQKAKGYNWILVNGEVTFEEGEPTGAMPGRLLRNGKG